MNLWNKWTTFKKDFHAKTSNRRPLLASECDSLVDAEKVRREVLRELGKKIPQIQNANLGEFKIRELNDEINKLMGRKFYWEKRIRELGGSDLRKGRQSYDIEGKELPGMPGYKYYGAAKDLPGVRELFAQADEEIEGNRKRKSRKELAQHITPDYYGFRDEDDGILVAKEAAQEKRKRAEAEADFVKQQKILKAQNAEITDKHGNKLVNASLMTELVVDNEEENAAIEKQLADWLKSVAGVDVSQLAVMQQQAEAERQEAIRLAQVEEKKKLLLEKFAF